ncbi:glutaredoxin-like protein [Chaetoceros tenuissimus]|uniref:Glutaredoxin-like protein n=1 Tax=Chaetoceros tenuissimus TaxID=426638 RepID=A0AAD3CTD8_9STRA|nr:glutaredoxin-like protein [Chaetoceros tenuissimus]
MRAQSVGLIFAAFVASAKGFTSPACSNLVSKEATSKLSMSDFADDFMQETPDQTQQRIQDLVDEHPVLLFMKGTKIFPSCGFSSTAVQILNTFNIDFHSVDVLADEAIRSGVKEFSDWPTIPQLYVAGEFIGGSDIMIEMYQSGELGEMIEKSKADMM